MYIAPIYVNLVKYIKDSYWGSLYQITLLIDTCIMEGQELDMDSLSSMMFRFQKVLNYKPCIIDFQQN